MKITGICAAAAAAILAVSASAGAQSRKLHLGLRGNVVVVGGKPTNDILGLGIYGHYRLRERWSLGFAVDHSPEFDVERIAALVGLEQDPAVSDLDAAATSIEIKAWIERVYARPGGRWEGFWAAGAGIGSVDVDDMTGPLAGGGIFDVATDVSTEAIVAASFGVRRSARRRLGAGSGAAGRPALRRLEFPGPHLRRHGHFQRVPRPRRPPRSAAPVLGGRVRDRISQTVGRNYRGNVRGVASTSVFQRSVAADGSLKCQGASFADRWKPPSSQRNFVSSF